MYSGLDRYVHSDCLPFENDIRSSLPQVFWSPIFRLAPVILLLAFSFAASARSLREEWAYSPGQRNSPGVRLVSQLREPSGGPAYNDSIVGDWRGQWENSLGQHGEASWEVSAEDRGEVRGIWDGFLFQGRRRGNIVTFHIDSGNHTCIDYRVRVEISPEDTRADFWYQADNHCNGARYTGTEKLRRRH